MSVPSHGTMAAFATTLIVFGIVGWSTGWLVADGERTNVGRDVTPSPVVTATQETPKKPTPTPPPSPSPSRKTPTDPCGTAPDAFAMPDVVGMKFMEARRKALDLGVTVNVHFNQQGRGPEGTVVSSNPEKGWCVPKGTAISLNVTGPVPKVKVPEVLGLACKPQAKDKVIDVGLTIEAYPSGDRGTVYKVEPPVGTELLWNAKVNLFCS